MMTCVCEIFVEWGGYVKGVLLITELVGSNYRKILIRVCEDNWKHDMIESICQYCDRVRYDNYPNPIRYCNETCEKIYYEKYYSKKNVLNVL